MNIIYKKFQKVKYVLLFFSIHSMMRLVCHLYLNDWTFSKKQGTSFIY